MAFSPRRGPGSGTLASSERLPKAFRRSSGPGVGGADGGKQRSRDCVRRADEAGSLLETWSCGTDGRMRPTARRWLELSCAELGIDLVGLDPRSVVAY